MRVGQSGGGRAASSLDLHITHVSGEVQVCPVRFMLEEAHVPGHTPENNVLFCCAPSRAGTLGRPNIGQGGRTLLPPDWLKIRSSQDEPHGLSRLAFARIAL